MRVACPDYKEKIIPIESNFDTPDLGLHEVVRNMLLAEVQVGEAPKSIGGTCR